MYAKYGARVLVHDTRDSVVGLFRTLRNRPMDRCSAGAAECATTKTDPTTFASVCYPNDRVNVVVRDG